MCLNILGLNIAKLSLLAFVNGPRMELFHFQPRRSCVSMFLIVLQ